MSNGKKTLAQEFSVLFNLPWYIFAIFAGIVLVAAYMGVLPQGMAGCFAFMIVLGTIMGKAGDNCPIIKADDATRALRLRICQSVKSILGNALWLIGMEKTERI